MRRLLILLSLSLTILCLNQSCCTDCEIDPKPPKVIDVDDETGNNPEDPKVAEGNILKSVNVSLPTNASIQAEDLFISSIFTENAKVITSGAKVELFNEDSFELLMASNDKGDVLMLSYVNPLDQIPLAINEETTALALVMMHPWTFEMSAKTKQDVLKKIKATSGFEELKQSVARQISNGVLNLSEDEALFGLLNDIQINVSSRIAVDVNVEPLRFTVERNKVKVLNYKSSAAYGIGLYDENEKFITYKTSSGLKKSRLISNGFENGPDSERLTAEFEIPGDGIWNMKATSGLTFDGSDENRAAAALNSFKIFKGVIGIFSSKLGDILDNTTGCALSLGFKLLESATEDGSISERLILFRDGNISGAYLSYDVFFAVADNIGSLFGLIDDCAGPSTFLYKINFKGLSPVLSFWTSVKSAFDTGALFGDWLLYSKSIDFCFVKAGDEIKDCLTLTVKGDFDFGEVGVFRKTERTIELINETDQDILFWRAYAYDLPRSGNNTSSIFRIENPFSDFPVTLKANESFDLTVSVLPKELIDYNAEISIGLPADFGENGAIDYSFLLEAKAQPIINKVKLATINQEIEYGKDAFLTFDVTNSSPSEMQVNFIWDIPEESSTSLFNSTTSLFFRDEDVIISPNETRSINVKVKATYVHKYTGDFRVDFLHNNGTGNGTIPDEFIEGNIIQYEINSTGEPLSTITENLNFGEILVDNLTSRSIFFSKNTYIPLDASISLPNGFRVSEESTFTLDSNFTGKNIIIIFEPKQAQQYSGDMVITNNYDNSEIRIPISGIGVNQD